MMKSISAFILTIIVLSCSAQDTVKVTCDSVRVTPDSVAARRNQLHKNNSIFLAAWAGANIVQGSITATNSTGSSKYFWKMNVYFNAINLAVAGYGLYAVKKEMTRKLSDTENYKKQNLTEKLLLLNTGLDAAYIMSGLYLNERGKRMANEKSEGYGSSLALQGSFLLVFDLVQYFEHRSNGKRLPDLRFEPTPTGAGLVYHF